MLKREELSWPLWGLLGVLGLLLLLGSFWDLQLGRLLLGDSESVYARILSAVGELPAFLLFISAGVTWFVRRGRSSRWLAYFSVAGSLGLAAGGILLTFLSFLEDLPGASILDCAVLSAAVLAAGAAFGLFLTRNTSRTDCFRFVFTVLFAGALAMLVVNLVKYPWSRPRLRLLITDETAAFSPWWRPLGIGESLRGDDYRSFPSGHTAMAACSLLWTVFPALNQRFEGRGRLLFFASCLWTVLIAMTRMTLGAHFLSDVTVSWLFILFMYRLSVAMFWRDSFVFCKLYGFMT